jgi:hypothetical protein
MKATLVSAGFLAALSVNAEAQMAGHEHHTPTASHETAGHNHPPAPAPSPAVHDHTEHDHAAPTASHDHAATPVPDHATGHEGHAEKAPQPAADHHQEAMPTTSHSGALGNYGMTRDASGTSWQPDASVHQGVMAMRGDWMLMGHATINGVYDWQDGPRGDEKAFLAGMIMASAKRTFASGDALQFRTMLSPDPFMGKRGYPLLLASGETADGRTPLIDRQHPHDLFMELSASYSHRLTDADSVYFYAGLPGEPAFGPPAFMHRLSIMDSPEAPISHHWLDSTHITFGVLTAGYVHDDWKLEVSRFRGREPDEHRYDIETGDLDSTAARLSWNPTRELSLQASWADVTSPEQLEPDEDQTKYSASAIYTRTLGEGRWWSTTLAWGRRSSGHDEFDAFALESAFVPLERWTVFARAERTENNELAGHHGPTFTVGKVSAGAVRDFPVSKNVSLGLGALYAANFTPGALDLAYGGDPGAAQIFARLQIK